jgi:hypothetical protein
VLALRRELDDLHGEADARHQLAGIDGLQGDYERARDDFTAVLALRRELGDLRTIAVTLRVPNRGRSWQTSMICDSITRSSVSGARRSGHGPRTTTQPTPSSTGSTGGDWRLTPNSRAISAFGHVGPLDGQHAPDAGALAQQTVATLPEDLDLQRLAPKAVEFADARLGGLIGRLTLAVQRIQRSAVQLSAPTADRRVIDAVLARERGQLRLAGQQLHHDLKLLLRAERLRVGPPICCLHDDRAA